jgi:hypothetical protein
MEVIDTEGDRKGKAEGRKQKEECEGVEGEA